MYLNGPRVLPIGDSITYDVTATLLGAYRYYLGEPFSQWFEDNIVWVGENAAVGVGSWAGAKMCGASGQRVDEINTSYDPGGQALRQRPNLAIIHLGTNDMTQLNSGAWVGGSVAISVANLSTLLTSLFTNKPDLLVCVCKIIPNRTAGADTLITQWNSAMETMVLAHPNASQIFIADCNAAFLANVNWSTDYMSDDTHPNNAGEALMASTILSSIQSNVTLMARSTAQPRRAIRPHTASLRYTTSTATILGTNDTLDTSQPWAVSFDIDLSRSSLTANNGILCFKTDQSTPFIILALGTNQRYIEFGSNSNFGRFFPNNAISPNVRDILSKGWHQVTLTYDGVSRSAATSYKLYIDGQSISVTSGAGLGASTDQNAIGAAVSGGVAGIFDMANLTIWNGGSVMTAQQAADWYYYNKFPSGPSLIRNYPHTDGSGGTLTDTTGNQNGTIGTATWTTANIPTKTRSSATTRLLTRDYPFSVLSKSSSSQYISITGDADFQGNIQNDFSAFMWVKFNSFATSGFVIGHAGGTDNRNFTLHFNGVNQLVARFCSGVANQLVNTSVIPKLGEWYLLGVSYKDSDHVRVFIGNNSSMTAPIDTAPTIDLLLNTTDMYLAAANTVSGFSDCQIAQYWVFNKSFTLAEAQALYFNNQVPSGISPVVELKFTNGSGATVTDTSGLSNNGTIVAGGLWSAETPFKPRTLAT